MNRFFKQITMASAVTFVAWCISNHEAALGQGIGSSVTISQPAVAGQRVSQVSQNGDAFYCAKCGTYHTRSAGVNLPPQKIQHVGQQTSTAWMPASSSGPGVTQRATGSTGFRQLAL